MRIVAWNLGHQTLERKIPATFIEAVKSLVPDILILNEYVHGVSRKGLVADLAELGLLACGVSDPIPKQNQVLMASRVPQVPGDLNAPQTTPAATANFLHVLLPSRDLEVVGLRAPAYGDRAQLETYWREVEGLVLSSVQRRILFVGDLNCDPDRPTKPGGRVLQRLRAAGWYVPSPCGDWSFISKNGQRSSRIDHAICSPMLRPPAARYTPRINGLVLAGSTSELAISDHAPLVLDVEW